MSAGFEASPADTVSLFDTGQDCIHLMLGFVCPPIISAWAS